MALGVSVGINFSRFGEPMAQFGEPLAPICAPGGSFLSPWDEEGTNRSTQRVHKSSQGPPTVIFPHPPGHLWDKFLDVVCKFRESCDFLWIELPCRRELNFQSPQPTKTTLRVLWDKCCNLTCS